MKSAKKVQISLEYHLTETMRVIRGIRGPGINKISEITTHLYLANVATATNPELLKEYGIRNIFHIGTPVNQDTKADLDRRKLSYVNLPTQANMVPHFENCYYLLQQNIKDGKKTIVCCESGISVSAVVLIYFFQKRYYITNYGRNRDKTLELISPDYSIVPAVVRFMKETRSCIDPEAEYIKQILRVEFQVKATLEAQLIAEARNFFKQYPERMYQSNDKTDDPDLYPDALDDAAMIKLYLDDRYNRAPEAPAPEFDKLEDLDTL